MTQARILFGLEGRLARLAYLHHMVVANIVVLLAMLAAYFLLLAFKPLGIVAVACIAIGAVWMSVALVVKRLHDIGLSGMHVAWIAAIDLVAILTSSAAPVTGLACLAILLWLLLAPGEAEDNAYGFA